MEADYAPLVWSVAEMIEQNKSFREHEGFAELYMPFDCLFFLGGDGGGDQCAYRVLAVQIRDTSWIFRWGQGTPAPVAPPRRLVVTGQYRHVGNPMYVALVLVVLGQAALLGGAVLVAYAVLLLVLFHLRVVTYEEPQLEKLFGVEFAAYRNGVPRWLPRLTGWNGSTAETVGPSADRRTGSGRSAATPE